MISYALPVEFELWSKKIQSFLEILKKKKKIINNMSKIKYTIKEVYREKNVLSNYYTHSPNFS